MNLPWFTNSEWLLVLPVPLYWLRHWFEILIDDTLPWDWRALLSISHVLVLQKSSDISFLFSVCPWTFRPFSSSTTVTGVDPVQQPKQPLLCYNSGLVHIINSATKITSFKANNEFVGISTTNMQVVAWCLWNNLAWSINYAV